MADFRITVVVDPTGAQRGARKVERSLNRVGDSANRTRALIARAFAFTTVAAGLVGGIRVLANFEQQMSTVRAISGATEVQFKSLREEASRLGITTRFSASEAAAGMQFLARAGFETNEVLAAIGPTLNLAQAGALGLARAADIASNVLKGFDLEAEETVRIVDVLAKTASKSNTNIEQLGRAMSFVAPAAAALGVSVETAAGAIGVLSDAGIQATRAGTGLRQIFIQLGNDTPKIQEALTKLGLVQSDLSVQTRGLIPVLESLRDANVSLGDATDLVGVRQATSLLVLLKSIPRLKELTELNENAAGSAKEMARIMDDNLNGALLQVRSAFQGLILALGEAGATGALRNFFTALAGGLRTVVRNIGTFVNAIEFLAILLTVRLARVAIPAVIAGIKALGIAIASNPLGALLTVVTLTTVALIAFADEITIGGDNLATLGELGTATMEAISQAMSGLVANFQNGLTIIAGLFGGLFSDIEFSLEGVLRVTARVADGIVGFFVGVVDAIVLAFDNLPASFEAIFTTAFNNIIRLYVGFLNFIIGGINSLARLAGRRGLEEIEAFQLELTPRAQAIGAQMDQAIADGISNQHAAEDALDGILIRAEELARNRIAQDIAEQGVPDGGPGRPDRDRATRPGPKESLIDPAFRALLDLLAEENRLLGFSTREREIQQGLLDAEDSLKRQLTSTERELLDARLRSNQALQDDTALLEEIQGPMADYERSLEALRRLLDRGAISTGEFTLKQDELRLAVLDSARDLEGGFERGLLRIKDQFGDLATVVEDTLVGAFSSAEDALVGFVQTGKFEFKDLVDSIAADITRLAIRQSITGPLANAVGGGGNDGSLLGGLLAAAGSFFGGGGASAGPPAGFLGGFEHGGSFGVGGTGGVDNNTLSINNRPVARVSRGETVSVTPKGGGGRPIKIFMTVQTSDLGSFERSQDQIAARMASALNRASRRNG